MGQIARTLSSSPGSFRSMSRHLLRRARPRSSRRRTRRMASNRRRSRQPLERIDLDRSIAFLLVRPEMMLIEDLDSIGLGRGEMSSVEDDAVGSSTELFSELETARPDRLTRSCASSSSVCSRSCTSSARSTPVTALDYETGALPSTGWTGNLWRKLDSIRSCYGCADSSSTSKRALHLQLSIPSCIGVLRVGERFTKGCGACPLLWSGSFCSGFDRRGTNGTSRHGGSGRLRGGRGGSLRRGCAGVRN